MKQMRYSAVRYKKCKVQSPEEDQVDELEGFVLDSWKP